MDPKPNPHPHYNPSRSPRIAVVTMGVKLGDEVRGYTRFRFLSELLASQGFDVDLITSSFQHWEKAQRECDRECYRNLPYRVHFIEEPGYRRNLDLRRIWSHHVAARGVRRFLEEQFAGDERAYDLIYAEVPPNDVARACAESARSHGIPFVADVNDLWPEAMLMAFHVPVLSRLLFAPFARDAKAVYELLDAAVGTSDEYAARPSLDRQRPYQRRTVYVGNDLSAFDDAAARTRADIEKPEGETWFSYAGTLGASYDLATLIEASKLACQRAPEARIRVKVLGDGPDRERLEQLARDMGAPVDFLGYQPYEAMAGWLVASDATVNSLVKDAPQSIVTKIGDYLASGKPMLNTGSSPEFRAKVEADGFGLNVPAEDADALAAAMVGLAEDPAQGKAMGARGRAVAEKQFDQPRSYLAIVELIRNLIDASNPESR